MLKTFPIEFIRQTFLQKLLLEKFENVNLFGGDNQVNIYSFYEQLKTQGEIDRFVDTYRELTEQQNRSGLILNGVLLSPENPTITNLYSCLCVPMTWSCMMRCNIANRDDALITINNLIEKLKGKKVDIAQLETLDFEGKTIYVPFMVGTVGQGYERTLKNGDYIGTCENTVAVRNALTNIANQGITVENKDYWLYCQKNEKLTVVYIKYSNNSVSFIEDDGEQGDIIFPPDHRSFEKYKLSLSFDAIRCDEPRNLNDNEYVELTFTGSATLVSDGVALGNDLLKVSFTKLGIKAETPITFNNPTTYYLEPLEMPSGSNANTQISQLVSNKFLSNSHTDSLALTLQYTFILDRNIPFLDQLFKYARYGTQGLTESYISPNMEYGINEIFCSWGVIESFKVVGKIIENIDIENTEGDILTISLSIQIQREWVVS